MNPIERSAIHPLDAGFLRLWYTDPVALDDPAVEQGCALLLDEDELARAGRFRFARHRHEFLATHALARTALSQAHPLPQRAWSYTCNEFGKPAPEPRCGLSFNQSNSLGLAVCLVGRLLSTPEVGVDVESFARAESILPLANRVFSPAEQAQLAALPTADRPARALSLWTLKEAYIKARGQGLSLPVENISFLFGGAAGLDFEAGPEIDANPGRWRFAQLDLAGHRIALAIEAAEPLPTLEIYCAQPPYATPAVPVPGRASWSLCCPA